MLFEFRVNDQMSNLNETARVQQRCWKHFIFRFCAMVQALYLTNNIRTTVKHKEDKMKFYTSIANMPSTIK